MIGTTLPALRIEVTPTVVISTALATRDFQDVHHDRDAAVQRGSKDIFLNILSTTGLVQRFVTEWGGRNCLVRGVSIKLGVPCYAGDTLTITGSVRESVREAGEEQYVVAVSGTCGLGEHVRGTVRFALEDAAGGEHD
ncbi:acyl dehydratase [Sciscionella sediminilitoris]|uniref:acyl dehydratase n=1 Tax=Sciscionella sediminilitoris TaxID=1445613 RepID=UPI000A5D4919